VNWVTWDDFREPAEFVETVPFTETREYIQAVVRNAALYRQIYQDGFPPEPARVAAKPASKKPAPTASVKKTPTAKKATRASATAKKKGTSAKTTARKKASSSGRQTAQGSKLRRSSPL
jgi:soluble lytic murein transglycosylase